MSQRPPALESTIARLLTVGTYASVALIGLGVVAMAIGGVDPLSRAPAFDPGRLIGDLLGLRPAGFLWLGILGVLATPASRVAASLVGYARAGERIMAWVALAILLVIAAGVVSGLVGA